MIKEINKTIQTSSTLSLKDEKALVKRAAELEALKPTVKVAHQQNEQTNYLKNSVNELKNRMLENYNIIGEITDELSCLQNQQNKLYQEFESDKKEIQAKR